MADWSNLPGDLLVLIAQRLASSMGDMIAFSAACKDWSQSMKSLGLPPRSPWLMLSDNVNDMVSSSQRIKQRRSQDIKPRSFFSPSSGKTYEFELPEASGRRCVGAGHGWLLTLGVDLNINLLHPFSRKQIPLPPMLALPVHYTYNDKVWPEQVFDMFIEKAALSANPKSSHDCSATVMIIYGECRYAAIAKLGDKVWTELRIDSVNFTDVVFYRGKFYIVNCHGVVFVCDLNNDESSSALAIAPTPSGTRCGFKRYGNVVLYRGRYYVEEIIEFGGNLVLVSDQNNDESQSPSATAIAPAPTGTEDWFQKYLVEFSGDLLLVQRFRVESTPEQPHDHVVFDSYEEVEEDDDEEEDEEEEEEEEEEDNIPRKYTNKFEVLKLVERSGEEGGNQYPFGWVRVSSLGNKSLFIGWNQSVCVSELKAEGGIEPNCIYFTDDDLESFERESDGRGGRDLGIFHMESGLTEPLLLQHTSRHRYSPPIWYF